MESLTCSIFIAMGKLYSCQEAGQSECTLYGCIKQRVANPHKKTCELGVCSFVLQSAILQLFYVSWLGNGHCPIFFASPSWLFKIFKPTQGRPIRLHSPENSSKAKNFAPVRSSRFYISALTQSKLTSFRACWVMFGNWVKIFVILSLRYLLTASTQKESNLSLCRGNFPEHRFNDDRGQRT